MHPGIQTEQLIDADFLMTSHRDHRDHTRQCDLNEDNHTHSMINTQLQMHTLLHTLTDRLLRGVIGSADNIMAS